ncbi:MAG: toxin-antitoxin system YwqK family antitoxin [Salinimicrobium sp.]
MHLQLYAQDQLNQKDDNGKRHGAWKVYFEDHPVQLKFEGDYEHGLRTGVFKYYQEGLKHPVATMLFDPKNDTVEVKYLSQGGKVISEGRMVDKQRIGTWKYYHKDSDKLMMVEHYENGLLEGEKLTYYDTGKLAEKSHYIKGELNGEKQLFSEKGVVLQDLTYENGELHGPAKIYNGKGELLSEGSYKRDKHWGLWRYYENGNLKEEKNYSK